MTDGEFDRVKKQLVFALQRRDAILISHLREKIAAEGTVAQKVEAETLTPASPIT